MNEQRQLEKIAVLRFLFLNNALFKLFVSKYSVSKCNGSASSTTNLKIISIHIFFQKFDEKR